MIKEFLHQMQPTDQHSLVSRLHFNALKQLIPLNATVELSTHCNFKCQHCYNFDRSQKPKDIKRTTNREIFSFLKDLKQLGGLYLSFTGGEPLLAPNLMDCLKEAQQLGFYIRLKSNASLLTESRAREIQRAGVKEMDISLYGASDETHDSFTRSKGQLKKTLNGILIAKNQGLNPSVVFIIHKKNKDEFQKMKSLCESWDIPFSFSLSMTARHDGSQSNLDWRLDDSDIKNLMLQKELEFSKPQQKATSNIQCGCARFNCAMAENGDIYPCIGAPMVAGNIFENSFTEIWKSSELFNKIRNLSREDYKTCGDCSLKGYCPRNSGTAFLNTGSYTAADPWSCATAKTLKEQAEA